MEIEDEYHSITSKNFNRKDNTKEYDIIIYTLYIIKIRDSPKRKVSSACS